jgi:hypothetical protein
LPGNLVEEYRAGMIATASPFTGFQPIAKISALSNDWSKMIPTGVVRGLFAGENYKRSDTISTGGFYCTRFGGVFR